MLTLLKKFWKTSPPVDIIVVSITNNIAKTTIFWELIKNHVIILPKKLEIAIPIEGFNLSTKAPSLGAKNNETKPLGIKTNIAIVGSFIISSRINKLKKGLPIEPLMLPRNNTKVKKMNPKSNFFCDLGLVSFSIIEGICINLVSVIFIDSSTFEKRNPAK
jgi:hypothetical protein